MVIYTQTFVKVTLYIQHLVLVTQMHLHNNCIINNVLQILYTILVVQAMHLRISLNNVMQIHYTLKVVLTMQLHTSINNANLNPLYDTECTGYTTAYFNQQCTLDPLYNSECTGYASAYLLQQCSIDVFIVQSVMVMRLHI